MLKDNLRKDMKEMSKKMKHIFKSVRVIILLVFLVLSIIAISPVNHKGVAILNVKYNSSASLADLSVEKNLNPVSYERIIQIDETPINNIKDYYDYLKTLEMNKSIVIITSKAHKSYNVLVKDKDLGLSVINAPSSNIVKGLDLAGGSRIILKPAKNVTEQEFNEVIDNLRERLNVYGLKDVSIRSVKDLLGNRYIIISIAGTTLDEIADLVEKQGKFETKIGNTTIFKGEKKDIRSICRTSQCSGIDPNFGCSKTNNNEYACRFRFAITLSKQAAENQAKATQNLKIITNKGEAYLEKPLNLYLDGKKVDSLNIAAGLKGKAETDIMISGSGVGKTKEEAIKNALKNMKRLQTILQTGSLPIKLEVVKTDIISPLLGQSFVKNSFLVGFIALLAVGLVVYLRYRKWVIIIPMILTSISELILLLGIAALIRWNIDIAAIAGIIVAIGTGVDDQIVITDETLKGESTGIRSLKEKIKRAFFIIMGSYITTVAAMIPLLIAGAGLVRGFALTTILGVSIGVFITRPTYAKVIEILLK